MMLSLTFRLCLFCDYGSNNLCKRGFCVFTYRARKRPSWEALLWPASGSGAGGLSELAVQQTRAEEELKVLPISSVLWNTWFGSVLTWKRVLYQKLELEERRKAEEELRRLEQERKQQIYISLTEVQGSKHTRDEEDKDWQKTCKEHCIHTSCTSITN